MNLLKYRWYFIGFFLLTMVLSIVFIFFNVHNQFGAKPGSYLNLGIDFTGGTKIYFPVSKAVTSDEVQKVLDSVKGKIPGFKTQSPQPSENIDSKGNRVYKVLIYTSFLNNTEQKIVIDALEAKFGIAQQGYEITRIDPLIGAELVNNALMAVIIASVLMIVYIWFRFELISGLAAIIALIHDLILVLGLTALFGLEINATIIAVLLSILGYSINDTIVIFDRIRENMKYRSKETRFVDLANDSILQTLRRSLYTGFTAILSSMLLFILVPNIRELCFGMMIGITSGTYSSIFIASPIWAIYKDWQEKKRIISKPAMAGR